MFEVPPHTTADIHIDFNWEDDEAAHEGIELPISDDEDVDSKPLRESELDENCMYSDQVASFSQVLLEEEADDSDENCARYGVHSKRITY